MATTDTRPATDDEPLTAADHAAIARALAEPGIVLTADELEQLLAGADEEVHELIAAGRVAEAIGVARFNAFEQQHPFAQRDLVARCRGA